MTGILYLAFLIIKMILIIGAFLFLIGLLIDICCEAADRKEKYNSAMNKDIRIYDFDHINPYTNRFSYEYKTLKEFPCISFSRFYNFYCVNPDSWDIDKYRVYKDRDNNLSFVFEYKEWKKYDKWRKQIEKEKELIALNKKNQKIAKEKDEITLKILESVQKDIDAAFNESKKKFNEAKELIVEVAKNLS